MRFIVEVSKFKSGIKSSNFGAATITSNSSATAPISTIVGMLILCFAGVEGTIVKKLLATRF